MEMKMLSLLMPSPQSKATSPQSGNGQPSVGFAELLAKLSESPGFGPKEAMIALQLAGPEERAAALPKLFAALLLHLLPAGSGAPLEQEKGGAESAMLLGVPVVSLELPPQPLAGGSGFKGAALLHPGILPQTATTVEGGIEKLLAEFLPATAGQTAVKGVEGGIEKLLAEPLPATARQAVAEGGIEKLLAEPLPAAQSHGLPDKPAATAKAAPEIAGYPASQTPEKTRVALPTDRSIKPEPSPVVQGTQALGYQAVSAGAALPPTVAPFAKPNVAQAAVAEQVLEKMVFSKEPDGNSTLFVRLKPATLGEVQISLRLEDGRLTARILTENLYVKEALDAALGQVKQRLEAQQLQVAELTVTVGGQQDFRQDGTLNPFWQQTNGKGKRIAAATPEKELSQSASLLQGLVDARV